MDKVRQIDDMHRKGHVESIRNQAGVKIPILMNGRRNSSMSGT